MNIFENINKYYKDKKEIKNAKCDQYIEQIKTSIGPIEELLYDRENFIDPTISFNWKNNNELLLSELKSKNIKKLKKADNFKTLLIGITNFENYYNTIPTKVTEHNERVANNKIHYGYNLIGKVEGRKLDDQQMLCIVKDVHNHLVIAGAGTGKTTTVVGKIKYLLKSGLYRPEDILVLSFTNASASEMSERINNETGYKIVASTFHKLGLNIIKDVEKTVPKITKLDLKEFVKEQLELNIQNSTYLEVLNTYLLYNHIKVKSEFEFNSKREYEKYLTMNKPITLNKELVKSYGEMDIANFLTQNGIKYIYEKEYKLDTRNTEYGQYYPDFYLPDYNIYIEYFGINRKGQVPSYFSSKGGLTPTETYQKGIEWKRKLHKENNTIMIECYSYEKFEGILADNLKNKLLENDVAFDPIDPNKIWQKISNDNNSILNGLVELFATIINLMKSNNYDIEKLLELNVKNAHSIQNQQIIFLLSPIFKAYCSYLKSNKEIDFNDMINTATKYVNENKYVNHYKYVIVDEYQDISKARFSLLESLRNSNDYDLFCVGDDWQSIYRFAGSDISYILNFEKYWGPTEISKIETTYRFSQELIEISGNFIMKNPYQIKKSIKGQANPIGFALGEINAYTDTYSIEFMLKKLDYLPKNSTVFFIGRYDFDKYLLNNNPMLNCNYNKMKNSIDVKYSKRPDLIMTFLTAHRSKGLQADYVFIINNKKSVMGFPSEIQDDAILDLLLENQEDYQYAEERRLFYVALTRAKKRVFVLTVKNHESEFIQELRQKYKDELRREQFTCPLCGGRLVKKRGPYGEFFGCSNYSSTGCKYSRKIRN